MADKTIAHCPIHRGEAVCLWDVSDERGVEEFIGHLRRHGRQDIVDAIGYLRDRPELGPHQIADPNPVLWPLIDNPIKIEVIRSE